MRAVIAVLLFFAAQEAPGCSCITTGDVRDEKRRAALTFVGRAVSHEPSSDGLVRITFEVLTAWRRDVPRVVSVLTASSGAACGYVPQVGELHLLFAHHSYPDRKFHIGLCSHNRALVCAQQDLARLGRPSTRHETLPAWTGYGTDEAPLPSWTSCVKPPEPIGDHSFHVIYGLELRKVGFTVRRDGSVADVTFELKCPGGCTPNDHASFRAMLERRRYKPPTLNGRPVAVRYQAAD